MLDSDLLKNPHDAQSDSSQPTSSTDLLQKLQKPDYTKPPLYTEIVNHKVYPSKYIQEVDWRNYDSRDERMVPKKVNLDEVDFTKQTLAEVDQAVPDYVENEDYDENVIYN